MTILSLTSLRDAETRARRAALRRYSQPSEFRLYAATIERIDFYSQHLPVDDAINELLKIYSSLEDKHYAQLFDRSPDDTEPHHADEPASSGR